MLSTQDHRALKLITPLGKDRLLFKQMQIEERLGLPFEYTLTALSDDHIDMDELLGHGICVEQSMRFQQATRHYHGIVTEIIDLTATGNKRLEYQLTVRPWNWLLTRRSDCRIYQFQSIPEIIQNVFVDNGFNDFKNLLTHDYPRHTYRVLYRETYFNFVQRLMEEAGIYYYFEHDHDRHTLVLADSYGSHHTIGGQNPLPYFPDGNLDRRETDAISQWRSSRQLVSGQYSLRDYDFEHPAKDLEVRRKQHREHRLSGYELYDYPGSYKESLRGEQVVRTRLEEIQIDHKHYQGRSSAYLMSAGKLFALSNHPDEIQNQEYLIQGVRIELRQNDYESDGRDEAQIYDCYFSAKPSGENYRPKRITPTPIVTGPQTATVVGPENEEIYTDEYGRVKVQFHWDRYGERDENSSCWIRVSQLWAGKNWGAMAIPRIGQEVIVDFLEGDPDQPIITGRVYNGWQKVPYPLPGDKTRMTVKSDTYKGEGYNELRFDDAKGQEQIFIHGQKDQDIIIENDRREHIGNDRHLKVDHDRLEQIGNDSSSKIDRDRTEATGRRYTVTVGEEQSVQIGSSYHLKSGKTQFFEAGNQIVLKSGQELTIESSGGFIKLDGNGITIQGKTVNINTGGAPGIGIPVQANMARTPSLATSGAISSVGQSTADSAPDAQDTPPKAVVGIKPESGQTPLADRMKQASKNRQSVLKL